MSSSDLELQLGHLSLASFSISLNVENLTDKMENCAENIYTEEAF